jgi:hypothetical protein
MGGTLETNDVQKKEGSEKGAQAGTYVHIVALWEGHFAAVRYGGCR